MLIRWTRRRHGSGGIHTTTFANIRKNDTHSFKNSFTMKGLINNFASSYMYLEDASKTCGYNTAVTVSGGHDDDNPPFQNKTYIYTLERETTGYK